jgi:hypothetical protein
MFAVGVWFARAWHSAQGVAVGVAFPAGAVVFVVWFAGGVVVHPAEMSMAAASSASRASRRVPVRMVVQVVYRY